MPWRIDDQIIDVFFQVRSVKVINNFTRLGLIHVEVKDIEPQIIKEIELKGSKISDINVRI